MFSTAFEGALTTFSTIFDGGFITGLPEMFFDAALLWQPYFPMRRREPVERAGRAILPSWSWVGWTGSLHSEDWVAGCSYCCDDDEELHLPRSHTVSTVVLDAFQFIGPPRGSYCRFCCRLQRTVDGKK